MKSASILVVGNILRCTLPHMHVHAQLWKVFLHFWHSHALLEIQPNRWSCVQTYNTYMLLTQLQVSDQELSWTYSRLVLWHFPACIKCCAQRGLMTVEVVVGGGATAYWESNSHSSSLTHLSYLSILSVSFHLLFISVPHSTSVFLPAAASVSVSLHPVHL